MKTIIIGGGLLGLATGLELIKRGGEVCIVEEQSDIALGASYANGGMFTPSMPQPWNEPGVWRHLITSIGNPQSPMMIRLGALLPLIPWGLEFLKHSSASHHVKATHANYALASYSRKILDGLLSDDTLVWPHESKGTMTVVRSNKEIDQIVNAAKALEESGLNFNVIESAKIADIEPHMKPVQDNYAGAIHFPDDQSGDARDLCKAMKTAFENAGGKIRLNAVVKGINVEQNCISNIDLGDELLEADRVIVAAGPDSYKLLKPLKLRLPVRPVKGYSLTFDLSEFDTLPKVPIVDVSMHAAATPLGNKLRLVGTAEFAGHDKQIRPERIDNLRRLYESLYPDLYSKTDKSTGEAWAGLRPMSSDGLPFIGGTPVKGLYLNTGHGHLGFTMANGAARILADIMDGTAPEIDASLFDPMPRL